MAALMTLTVTLTVSRVKARAVWRQLEVMTLSLETIEARSQVRELELQIEELSDALESSTSALQRREEELREKDSRIGVLMGQVAEMEHHKSALQNLQYGMTQLQYHMQADAAAEDAEKMKLKQECETLRGIVTQREQEAVAAMAMAQAAWSRHS